MHVPTAPAALPGRAEPAPSLPHPASALPAPLGPMLDAALAGPDSRVSRLEAGGRSFWLKRPERLSLSWRLRKGNPLHALQTERAALRELNERHMPVAELVAAGDDYILTADAGPSLHEMIRAARKTPAATEGSAALTAGRRTAFAAAGRSLAALHHAGLRHGRPSIRDICWDGVQARFIDFERWRPGRVSRTKMATDLLILVHSILAAAQMPVVELGDALLAYSAEDGAAVLLTAQRMALLLGWFAPLLRGLLRLHRSRDLAAIALTLDCMGGRGKGCEQGCDQAARGGDPSAATPDLPPLDRPTPGREAGPA